MELSTLGQIPIVETTAALGASATFTSTSRDCEKFQSFGISTFIQRSAVDTNIDVFFETSDDGVTFRVQDTINLPVTAAAPTASVNRIYSTTRRYARVRLVNNTANALLVTELSTVRRPD